MEGSLGELDPSSRRGLARNLFAGFYERKLSANDALNELRAEGLGYRRQDFLNDYRIGEGRYAQETKVRFIGEESIPSESILQSQYHGVEDKYSFVFKASYTDEEGNVRDQYFYYHRNTLDTRSNMEDDAYDFVTSTETDSGKDNVSTVSLVEGYINPVWG